MRPGIPPAPRLVLNPAFRLAVRIAMANGWRLFLLAHAAGFPHATMLSNVLADGVRVATTPLTVSRLQRLADRIQFSGPLFVEATEPEHTCERAEAMQ